MDTAHALTGGNTCLTIQGVLHLHVWCGLAGKRTLRGPLIEILVELHVSETHPKGIALFCFYWSVIKSKVDLVENVAPLSCLIAYLSPVL